VPLLFFLFLASGKVNFNKLPIITEKVSNLKGALPFRNKISVVSILGESPSIETYQNVLNLYQVIYKSMEKYKDFQLVTLVPDSNQNIISDLNKELIKVGGVALNQWKFISLPDEELKKVISSFGIPSIRYNIKTGLENVFIIDDELNLRGRTDDEDSESGLLLSYDTGSVAILKNKLKDDLDVVFYESLFAVKQLKLN
jgi:hypothetical protein